MQKENGLEHRGPSLDVSRVFSKVSFLPLHDKSIAW